MARHIDPVDRLRRFIAEHGTQKQAAAALGVSQSYLSGILRGRFDMSDRMVAALGLTKRVVIEEAR